MPQKESTPEGVGMTEGSTPKKEPMAPNRMAHLPKVYGDTPTFLGCAPVDLPDGVEAGNVVLMGVPWEGAVTWGSFSGCELATKTIRHASARYGGYLPEYEVDVLERLTLRDAGDLRITPGDGEATMAEVRTAAGTVYARGGLPVFFGGDHSYTPEVVRALAEHTDGEIGVIHLDAHLDNMPEFGGDPLARCGPLHRVIQCPGVRSRSVVHLGIRGPRNAPLQMALAREAGSRVITMREIRDRGLLSAMDEALEVARRGTRAVYLTICSDILDAATNPGGPPDFDGLTSHELFELVHGVALQGVRGIDYVEIYPLQDPTNRSSHLAVWTLLHALAGVAMGRGGQKG
jgi:agmatinase